MPSAGTGSLVVPPGFVYSVRSLKIHNSVAIGSTSFTMWVNAVSNAGLLALLTFTQQEFRNVDPFRLVLEAGETLFIQASAAGALHLTLDGFAFTS